MITQENIPYTADEIKAMVKTCEKYNKALERASELLEQMKEYDSIREDIEYVFPELKEPEDEQMWIEIRNFIWGYPDKLPERDKWLAWLEKQGENKDLIAEIKNRKALLGAEKEKAISSTDKLSLDARIAMLDELLAWLGKQGEKKSAEDAKKLDADKVIEWLKNTIKERAENYGVYKATRLILPYNSIEDLINDFKEDLGL